MKLNLHSKAALTVSGYVLATAALIPLAAATANPQTVDQLPNTTKAAIAIAAQVAPHTPPTASVQEDDPAWDCATMGNRICADPQGIHRTEAWEAWDTVGGWRFLRADPNVENRVDYIGTATLPPNVDTSAGYGAIPAGTGWYVFRAVPVDIAPTTTTGK